MPVRTAYVGTEAVGDVLTKANFDKLPGGWLGYAEVTANQTTITTIVDITGLTLTVTANANRRLRIEGFVLIGSTVATDIVRVTLADGSNNILQIAESGAANGLISIQPVLVVTPAAGSLTYKLRAARQAGTGTVTVNAAATFPNFILVEDIGPAS